jgi:hypothetical protein
MLISTGSHERLDIDTSAILAERVLTLPCGDLFNPEFGHLSHGENTDKSIGGLSARQKPTEVPVFNKNETRLERSLGRGS